MPAKSLENPPAVRPRLDAVALTLLICGGGLAAALGSHLRSAGNSANLLGPAGDRVAAVLVDTLGWASVVFLVGWFLLTGLLVVNRSPWRFVRRLLGWLLLTVVAAVAFDWYGRSLPSVCVAGAGGGIGAYLRFTTEDELDPITARLVWGVVLAVGVLLAAGWLVRNILRLLARAGRSAWRAAVWANDRVAAVSDAVLLRLQPVALYLGRGLLGAIRLAGTCLRSLARWGRKSAQGDFGSTAATPLGSQKEVAGGRADPSLTRTVSAGDGTVDPAGSAAASAPPGPSHLTSSEPIPIHTHGGPTPIPLVRPTPSPAVVPTTASEYQLPPLTLLNDPEPFPIEDHQQKLREMAALLEKTCLDFGITIKVVGIHTGPVITQYEVALETGLRLNKVTALADDLALNLRVPSVRVVAPLPGRNTVGIEVPNEIRQTVRLKEVVAALANDPKVIKYKLPLFIGKDVEGRPLAFDLAAMPHLLIAGRTGTGKSVCLNAIILSLLLSRRPDETRMILIDPKKVELSDYAHIPHLMTPVVKDVKKAEAILAWAVDKMEERYEWLHRARVRNIASYNELPYEEIVRRVNPDNDEERRNIPRSMPYIVIVIDEVADLIMQMKKEIESSIILLAQKSRAAGIHLVLATQKPTVDVITGLIKSNLPARICFQVNSRSDSAVVLDEKGAEKLLGMGDMLILQQGSMLRAQGAYVDDREIERVVSAIATDTPNYDHELLNLKTRDQVEAGTGGELGERLRDRDPLYEQAVEIVIREQRGSTSLLQRALGIGYGKASRFIDYMAEDGIVGGYNGSNARQVLISSEEWEARRRANA